MEYEITPERSFDKSEIRHSNNAGNNATILNLNPCLARSLKLLKAALKLVPGLQLKSTKVIKPNLTTISELMTKFQQVL